MKNGNRIGIVLRFKVTKKSGRFFELKIALIHNMRINLKKIVALRG